MMRTGDEMVRGRALNEGGAEALAREAAITATTRLGWTVEIERVPGYVLRLRHQDVLKTAPGECGSDLARGAAEVAWELLERTPGELADHEHWDGDESARAFHLSQFGGGRPSLVVGDLVRVTAPNGGVTRLGCGCIGWYDMEDEEPVAEAESCTTLQAKRPAGRPAGSAR
jgi:hypothetical protein